MAAEAKTEPIATRHAYGDALAELGELHDDVVALDADLAVSTQSIKFGKRFPERFFNVGAAEANMMSLACGLAATGKVPYCSTFAIFAAGRAYDQIRLGIAHNELKIRVGASHGGVSLGEDGASHQMSHVSYPAWPPVMRRSPAGASRRRRCRRGSSDGAGRGW
jgi:transketolase